MNFKEKKLFITSVIMVFQEVSSPPPQGKRPLGRPRRRWEDNFKIGIFRKWDVGTWTGFMWR
jgi:hypothetical protein